MIQTRTSQWFLGAQKELSTWSFRRSLQRRNRAGFAPASLFSFCRGKRHFFMGSSTFDEASKFEQSDNLRDA